MSVCLTYGDPVELLLDMEVILTGDRTWVYEHNSCATMQWIVLVNRLHCSYNVIHTKKLSTRSFIIIITSSRNNSLVCCSVRHQLPFSPSVDLLLVSCPSSLQHASNA